jgi:pectate lyase
MLKKNMKRQLFIWAALAVSLTAMSQDFDKPFGFCTVSSRTDASSTYEVTGGGCYTYPLPENFTGKSIVLSSNGQDMKSAIQNAIKQNDVIILDGSNGDFIVSSSIGFERGNKTILGINNARLCTKWFMTDEIKNALNAAGVPSMSTSSGGGTLSNGQKVSEQAEFNTRQIIINLTGDSNENYRKSGIFSLNKENVIIRNLACVGPGSVDAGGYDLISATGAAHCWIDHCSFQDGMDGNFDITNASNFITVSYCTFSYSARSYMHQNTNLVGSNDNETQGTLNTTFAFNWWGTGCNQRMPMARVGKIHMLNNYFNCAGNSSAINPRTKTEFLIEGNYFDKGVKNYYRQDGATAVTWDANNYIAEASSLPASIGSSVSMPYTYSVTPCADVPTMVQEQAGATLPYGNSGGESSDVKGSVLWPLSSGTNAEVSTALSSCVASANLENGSNLMLNGQKTYNGIHFTLFQAQTIQKEPSDDNVVIFSLTTQSGYKFKASSIELYACKVGTNNGTMDISWKDAGGRILVFGEQSPNRNNAENGYFSYYSKDISSQSTATEGTCSLILNLYNLGAMNNDNLSKKDIGLAQVMIQGSIIDSTTGIATPVVVKGNGDIYNMSGQRVNSSYKGIVIMNGKKVIIK